MCRTLREPGVNIEALFVTEDDGDCWVHLIARPTEAVEAALDASRFRFFTETVLMVRAAHRPGELERIARLLADGGVDVNYVYGSGCDDAAFTVVLGVSDVELARRALGGGD